SSKPFLLAGPALMFALLARGPVRQRRAFHLLFVVTAGWIGLFSLGRSKLIWYAYPVFPLIALAVASLIWERVHLLATQVFACEHRAAGAAVCYGLLISLTLGKCLDHVHCWGAVSGPFPNEGVYFSPDKCGTAFQSRYLSRSIPSKV